MAKLQITKGLDVPIKGVPAGEVQPLVVDGRPFKPREIALDFSPFTLIKPKLVKKAGEAVKIGEPLVGGKQVPGRMFVSPASGVIKEVRRGLKRRLLSIVIEVSEHEEFKEFPQEDPSTLSRERLTELLMEGGIFAHIRRRPFDLLADPHHTPRAIFVSAAETAPFQPSAEMQVEGFEEEFKVGIEALKKLTDGPVHLVRKEESTFDPFVNANCETHTISGPHPAGNHSVHIQMISPIQSVEEVVWTLRAVDVVSIGHLLKRGRIHTERVVSVAGPGVLDDMKGFFRVRAGTPISSLIAGRVEKGEMRFISGDVLKGSKVDAEGFLGFYDTQLAVIPESVHREMLHFFRLGIDKYSASHTYLSGFLSDREYDFNTSNHGEHRAFIIAKPYDAVMPMNIPTMQLVKAVMAEDYDLAEELGFLEVAGEDFALATFVCPSKMEMIQIIEDGLKAYAVDVLH